MRTVQFNMWDRLVLTPMELVPASKAVLPVLDIMLFANKFIKRPFNKQDFGGLIGSVLSGAVIMPILLPYVPGKAFSLKGWLIGLECTAWVLGFTGGFKKGNRLLSAGHLLLFPAVSSFLDMFL